MGKKKAFIDKKNATVYSLVHRSADSHDVDPDMPPSDPRALYMHFFGGEEELQESMDMSDAARKENLEYGFPDDGYDYMRHLRVIGTGQASMQGVPPSKAAEPAAAAAEAGDAGHDPAGPSSSTGTPAAAAAPAPEPAAAEEPSQSVFLKAPKIMPAAADVKLVDARRVAVCPAAAAAAPSSPTAAAPGGAPVEKYLHGRLAAELKEIEQLMAAAEAGGDVGDAAAAAGEEGLGDLLDDFVITAAEAAQLEDGNTDSNLASSAAAAAASGGPSSSRKAAGRRPAAAPAVVGNPEQRSMVATPAFAALTDQFDHLLGAYQDDQLGDLDHDTRAAGTASLDDFKDQMQDYLREVSAAAAAGGGEAPVAAAAAAAAGRGGRANSSGRPAATTQAAAAAGGADSAEDEDEDEYEEFSSELSSDEQEEDGGAAAAAASSSSGGGSRHQQQQPMVEWQRVHGPGGFSSIPEDASWDGSQDGSQGSSGEADEEQEGEQGSSSRSQGGRVLDADAAAAAAMAARRRQNKANRLESFEHQDPEVVAAVRARLAVLEQQPAAAGVETMYVPVHREQWDCESVLSLRSHVSYQPGKIASEPARSSAGGSRAKQSAGGLIKLSARTGLPAGYTAPTAAAAAGGSGGATSSNSSHSTALTKQALAAATAAAAAATAAAAAAAGGADADSTSSHGDEGASVATSLFERPKGESSEERKARKAAIKEGQRQARAAKKALKTLYTQEGVKQRRQAAAAQVGATFYIP